MCSIDLLKSNIIRLKCGSQEGTAFLIDNNIAITARHCIVDKINNDEEINLEFLNLQSRDIIQTTAEILNEQTTNPIAILKIKTAIEIPHLDMAILNACLERNERMITFGYPAVDRAEGWPLDLIFVDENTGLQIEDSDWRFRPDSELINFKGYSGSPLIFENKILGVILKQITQKNNQIEKAFSLNAISNGSIRKYLESNKIVLQEIDYQEIKRKEKIYLDLANIPSAAVGIEVNCNNYDSNLIVKSEIPIELLNEIEGIYREKLKEISQLKLEGKEVAAWEALRNTITKLKNSAISNNALLAKFYYLLAIWYLEDKSDGTNAQKYFNKAIKLDPEMDTRIYNARKRYHEGTCNNVLDILFPLENTSLLNAYLQLCVFLRESDKAERVFNETNIEPSDNTFYMMALIYILKHDLIQAEQYIDLALAIAPNIPSYLMMKGVILYWHAVPCDIVTKQDLLPVMFEPRMVHVSESALEKLDSAVSFYQKAFDLAENVGNIELMTTILMVWLDSLSISAKYEIQSKEIVEKLLRIDSFNSLAIVWKCRRNISVNDYDFKEFENKISQNDKNKLGLMIALINLCLAKNDKESARRYLARYKYEFNRMEVLEYWFDLRIHSAENVEDIEIVEDLMMKSKMDEEYKKRFKGVILECKNCRDELIEYAKSLYEESRLRIDLVNLVHSCDKYKQWEKMEEYSLIWASEYNDELAKCNVIKAQLMQYEWERCLKSVEQYESSYELNNEIRFYKAQALKIGRRYSYAISEAEQLWLNYKSEHILLLLAECYFLGGQEEDAISKLKEGISQGIREPKIYIMLAEHLKVKATKEAKKYAQKAYVVSNESKKVMTWCISFLFQIGESAEAGVMLSKYRMNTDIEEDEYFKAVPIKEALKIFEAAKKESLERFELYSSCKIPYHIYIDVQNTASYATLFWNIWRYNSDDKYEKASLYSIFGGHHISPPILKDNINEQLILDYSACILFHEIGLLKYLGETMSKLWVSGNIFTTILNEKLCAHLSQPDLIHERQMVMEQGQKLNIIYHKFPDADALALYEDHGMQLQDIIPYEESKKHGLVWIENNLGTEVLGDTEKVLEEVREAAVKLAEFLIVLLKKNIISEDTFEKYDKNNEVIRERIVNEILNNKNQIAIFVDFEFLETLSKLDCLNKVSESCELHAFENIFDHVIKEKEDQQLVELIQEKLESLEEKLMELKASEVLDFIPYMESEVDSVTVRNDHYLELKDAMLFSEKKNIPFVCNDRMVTSYVEMGDAPILSVIDVIEYLFDKKVITSEFYLDTIKKLMDQNICYFLPSYEYMKLALQQNPVGGDRIESTYLISVRRYLQRITNPESAMMKTVVNHVMLPESVLFMNNLQGNCMNLLKWIWDNDKDLSWKQRKSIWLINYYSEFGYFFLFFAGDKDSIIRYQTVRIAEFIFKGIYEITNRQNKGNYYKWLFTWLKRYFYSEPGLEDEVAEYFGDFLEAFLDENGDTDEMFRAATVKLLLEALKVIPEDFSKKVIENSKTRKIMEKYTRGVVVLDSEVSIKEEIFNEWIEAAMGAGIKNEIIREDEGVKYKIIFNENSFYIQNFEFYWESGGKENHLIYTIEGACLCSKDSLIRVKGFNKIADYLSGSERKMYIKSIEQNRNLTIVEEIIDKINQSSQFWFVKIEHIFNSSYNSIFDLEEVFPIYKEIFLEIMPVYEMQNWKESCEDFIIGKNLYEVLDMLIKLPIGAGINGFLGTIKAIVKGGIDNSIVNWCEEKLLLSQNPVELINMLYFFNDYDASKSETIIFRLLEEVKDEYSLFIELVKFAWSSMETCETYSDESLENKFLFCYLFAGEVQKRMLILQHEEKLRHEICDYIEWFSKVNKNAGLKQGVLELPLDEDISSPKSISKAAITATAVCNFIVEKQIILEDKEKFKQLLEHLVIESFENADLYLEFVMSDKERPNVLKTLFSGSLFELMVESFKINEIDSLSVKFAPEPQRIFSEISQADILDIKDFAFLYVYSKDTIQQDWIPYIIKIIDNYSILNTLGKRTGKFQCIASLLQKCPQEYQKIQIERFREEIKQILLSGNTEEINENFSTLEVFSLLANNREPLNEYLNFLEEITQKNMLRVNKRFMDTFSLMRLTLETEDRQRAQLIQYRFMW